MSRASNPIAATSSRISRTTATRRLAPELAEIFSALGRRRAIPAGARIVEAGSEARFYHVVESGVVAVLDPESGPERPVAYLTAGEMFSLDCGAHAAMTGVAVLPSIVVALDRRRLDALAREIPALAALIRSTHAIELSRILESTARRRRGRATIRPLWSDAAAAASRFAACARAVEQGSRRAFSNAAASHRGSGRHATPAPAARA